MEGVGARLGRSSTRYGPGPSPTVFSGPVRKWKKRWVHISPSSSQTTKHNGSSIANGSRLLLFKWTKSSAKDDVVAATDAVGEAEEPPRRKFKYIPIVVLEEQKFEADNEAAEDADNEVKPSDANSCAAEPNAKNGDLEEKPDINDMPMDESQALGGRLARQDLNEGTFDLSLG